MLRARFTASVRCAMNPERGTAGELPQVRAVRGAIEYGFWTFIVVAVGRVGELIPGLSAIPLAKLSLGLALVGLFRNWKDRPRVPDSVKPIASTAKWLFALAIILCPFSIWQGSSLHFLTQVLPILIATMLVGFYMSRSWNSVRGSLLALVVSGVVLVRAALAGFSGGRAAAATMYDTNDLAYVLVVAFPAGYCLYDRSEQDLEASVIRCNCNQLLGRNSTYTIKRGPARTSGRRGIDDVYIHAPATAHQLRSTRSAESPIRGGNRGGARGSRSLVPTSSSNPYAPSNSAGPRE